jgi:hypothetical protein
MDTELNVFYVYALIDQDTKEIFYVGKGSGYRDSSHLKPSLWKNPKETVNPFLYYKIRSLMNKNKPPIIKRMYENLSESEAYDIETRLIKEYGRRFSEEKGKLFNISDTKGGSLKGIPKPWNNLRYENHKNFWKNKRLYDPSYDELYNDFIEKNMKRKEIAKKYSISESLVKKRLEYFGIKKPKKLAYPEKNKFFCVVCNNLIITPNSVKKRIYCSRDCYFRNKNVQTN